MGLVNLNKPEGFEPKLLVADMDATMIVGECLDEMADAFGLGEKVKAITAKAMRGEMVFDEALEARVSLLKGLTVEELSKVADGLQLQKGAKTLIARLKERGCRCVLVSGGFTYFAERVAAELGFDRVVANKLVIENDQLTGEVAKPYVVSTTKVAVMTEEVSSLGIGFDDVLSLGDGANDIPMLTKAGWGIAYEGKPAVREAVSSHLGTAEALDGDYNALTERL